MNSFHAASTLVLLSSLSFVSSVRFLHGPEHVTVTEGQTATLRCQFQGKGTATVYWWSTRLSRYITADTRFIQVSDSSRYAVAYNPQNGFYVLQIPNIMLADAGEYKCAFIVNNVVSARSATVTVQPRQVAPGPPVCSSSLPADQVRVGQEITLSCSSEGGSPPAHLTWEENGLPVSDPVSAHVIVQTFVLEPHHNGLMFTCRSTHPTFHAPMTCSLVPFRQIPEASIEPATLRGVVGGTASFKCLASGVPSDLQIFWLVFGHPVDASNPRFEIVGEGNVLVITDLTLDENGSSVSCSATNVNGLTSSAAEASLKVTQEASTPTPEITVSGMFENATGDRATLPPGLPNPEVSGSEAAESSSLPIILIIIAAIIVGQFAFIALVYAVHRVTNRMRKAMAMSSLDARVQEMNLDTDEDGGPSAVVSHSAVNGTDGTPLAAVGGNVYKSLHRYDTPNSAVKGTTQVDTALGATHVDTRGYAATSKVHERDTLVSETSDYHGLPSDIPVYTPDDRGIFPAATGAGDYLSLHRYSSPNPAIEETARRKANQQGQTDTYGYTANTKLRDVNKFNYSTSSESSEYRGPPSDVPEYASVPKGYQGISREIASYRDSASDEDSEYVLSGTHTPPPDYTSVPRVPERNDHLPKVLHDYEMVPKETTEGKGLPDYDDVPDEALVYDIPSPRESKHHDAPIEKINGYAVMRPSMSLESN